jgi:restriction system protein
MTFWTVRAGKHGESENYNIENSVVAVGWHEFGDLSKIASREALQAHISKLRSDKPIETTRIWTGELWAFKERIQIGDWVALPLKSSSSVAMGRVTGPYRYLESAPEGARHQRPVEWVRTDLPRTEIDPDLLASLGSTLTVFRVKRNNAEERLAALVLGKEAKKVVSADGIPDDDDEPLDIEQLSSDQIADHIGKKFHGHELSRLVGEILAAEGYQVRVSPPGADGGVDIIAGSGPMGFEQPRIAVQVKSGKSPADVSILRELQGVMPQFGAEHGLLVSWAGFNTAVTREARQLFFKVRLWDAGNVVNALQANYDKLPKELQAEIPLKRTWILVEDD